MRIILPDQLFACSIAVPLVKIEMTINKVAKYFSADFRVNYSLKLAKKYFIKINTLCSCPTVIVIFTIDRLFFVQNRLGE